MFNVEPAFSTLLGHGSKHIAERAAVTLSKQYRYTNDNNTKVVCYPSYLLEIFTPYKIFMPNILHYFQTNIGESFIIAYFDLQAN